MKAFLHRKWTMLECGTNDVTEQYKPKDRPFQDKMADLLTSKGDQLKETERTKNTELSRLTNTSETMIHSW